ncbi:MAG: hypothetical protein C4541_11160 [Candidatus Auribacter fodinae]|uniref:Uncharacterized protein n=1 Tax=Candidatus Auribacter fodinae TaxID=2093366 RepID=A0A3A4R2J0_9BACT|nr:MAG: hypothetical protein C4541_11160 [Candidatus Auribacter fodinae]
MVSPKRSSTGRRKTELLEIIQFVGNRHACSLQRNHGKLPLIIGAFKSAVTKKSIRCKAISFLDGKNRIMTG